MTNNHFSAEDMVELGMNMYVAKQMMETMNAALAPNTNRTDCVTVQSVKYHIVIGDKVAGPYNVEEISRLISEGKITKKTLMWKPGMANWDNAENISEILKCFTLLPPPIPLSN